MFTIETALETSWCNRETSTQRYVHSYQNLTVKKLIIKIEDIIT